MVRACAAGDAQFFPRFLHAVAGAGDLAAVPWALMYASPTGAAASLIAPDRRSNSSAISIGNAVYTPWPISERSTMTVIELSAAILKPRIESGCRDFPFSCGAAGLAGVSGNVSASIKPPPTATVALKNSRRLDRGRTHSAIPVDGSAASSSGGAMNRLANAGIGAATADVSRHRRIDVGIAGAPIGLQQRGCRHDLAGLAVTALRHVEFHPCLLQHMAAVFRESFDGGDGRVPTAPGAARRSASPRRRCVRCKPRTAPCRSRIWFRSSQDDRAIPRAMGFRPWRRGLGN